MTTSNSKPVSQSQSPSSHPASPVHPHAPVVMPPANLAKTPVVPVGAPTLAKGEVKRMRHLNTPQVAALAALGAEFQRSQTWTEDFGIHVPSQAVMVSMVTGTAAVITESVNAKNWATYLHDERVLCSDSLSLQLESVGTMFEAALAQNPGLAQTYPSLVTYLAAQRSGAVKARVSRKAKAAAAKAKAAATHAWSSTAAAVATEPGPAPPPRVGGRRCFPPGALGGARRARAPPAAAFAGPVAPRAERRVGAPLSA